MESSPSKAYFEEEVEREKAARSALVGELSERTEPTKSSKYLNKLHERDANGGMTPRARHNVRSNYCACWYMLCIGMLLVTLTLPSLAHHTPCACIRSHTSCLSACFHNLESN